MLVENKAYRIDRVNIKNGTRSIPAIINIPTGDGPFKTLVMNHGHGGSKEENGGFETIANSLSNKGILTIRMDFPGCGESDESFTENYISNMISDSNASLEYVIENYEVDKNVLGIFGYSMGGRVAMEISTSKDTLYKSIGLLAPSSRPGKEVAVEFLGGKDKYDKLYTEASSDKAYADFETIFGERQKLSKTWFIEMENSYPLENIYKFKGNMLVVYGGKDQLITKNENEKLLSVFPNAESLLIEEADHGFGFFDGREELKQRVSDFVTEFFQKTL